jgi:hypothetical protein
LLFALLEGLDDLRPRLKVVFRKPRPILGHELDNLTLVGLAHHFVDAFAEVDALFHSFGGGRLPHQPLVNFGLQLGDPGLVDLLPQRDQRCCRSATSDGPVIASSSDSVITSSPIVATTVSSPLAGPSASP